MQTKIIGIVTLLIVCFAITQAFARPTSRFDEQTQTCRFFGTGEADWNSRPWGEGGKAFKQVCKNCHSKNNQDSAPYLWEESKTSKAWNRVFSSRYPACAKNGNWSSLTHEQLLSVNDYLYRFSYDGSYFFVKPVKLG